MNEASTNLKMRSGGAVSRWLFNPFYYIAGEKALMIGIAVMLITGFFANFRGARFNGLLDFHPGLPAQPWWINVSEILISWFIFSCLLLVSGKIVSKSRVRSIDIFGTQALARVPYLFVSLVAFIPVTNRFTQKLMADPTALLRFSLDMMFYIFILIFVLLMLVWMIVLMYRAFSISCNIVGKAAIPAFIAALIIGEILSFAAIHFGSQALPDQRPDLTSRAGELVAHLSNGEYARVENMFDEKMAAALPSEMLESMWQTLTTQFGSFKSQGTIQKTEVPGYYIVYVPCRFENATLNCQIAFDNEGRVSGLYFRPTDGN